MRYLGVCCIALVVLMGRADKATHKGDKAGSSAMLWLSWNDINARNDGGHAVRTDPNYYRGICRVRNKGGCGWAHGELWFGWGYKHCRAITKEKVFPPSSNYQVLYATGTADYEWRDWPQGEDNLNFPPEVVVSDSRCKTMVGRYNDYKEVGSIYPDGHVYYQHGPGEGWYWDNNEYSLLVEKEVTKIETLEMNFGSPILRGVDKKYAGNKASSSVTSHNCKSTEKTMSTRLSISEADTSDYSHSMSLSVTAGMSVQVTSPAKAAIGGFETTYSLETSYSYEHGWSTGKTSTIDHEIQVQEVVPPYSAVHVEMFLHKTTRDVPYTAKYRIHFQGGSSKITTEKGIMKNISYAKAYTKSTFVKEACDGWTKTSKIWNNDECKFIGAIRGVTAEKCKSECKNKQGCTAVNYAPKVQGGDCVFRKCGIPVPAPKWDYKNYNGYYMNAK